MQISIRHQFSVSLGQDLPRAVQHLLLTPQTSAVQTVRDWTIEVPGLDNPAGFPDAFGNRAHLASQTKPDDVLTITVTGTVETHDRSGIVGRPMGEPVPTLFLRVTPLTKPIGAIVTKFRSLPRTGRDRIPLLHLLMTRVGEVLGGAEQTQSQEQSGQSQSQAQAGPVAAADFAHAFVGAARALDIPARYITGYLAADDAAPTSFHAWAEAWDDALGWVGFDATMDACPADRHVRVAAGLDALTAVPVRSVPAVDAPQNIEMRVEAAQ